MAISTGYNDSISVYAPRSYCAILCEISVEIGGRPASFEALLSARSLYYRVNERVNMVFCPVLLVLPSLREEKLNYPVVFANNKTAWKHEGGRRVSVSTLSTFQR